MKKDGTEARIHKNLTSAALKNPLGLYQHLELFLLFADFMVES